MSRQIDHSKPLSDEDREYLKVRGRENEIIQNDINHGNLREMTDEERAEAEQQAVIEARGQRTPSLMDNSLIEEQHEQRTQTELDQLATHSQLANGDYDEDDVAFVQQMSDDEMREWLRAKDLDESGTRAQMGYRILDVLAQDGENSDAEDDGGEDDNYDDKSAWSYEDLQSEAKTRQLNAGGSREDIIARLREFNKQQG
jgi:hypothetical protein